MACHFSRECFLLKQRNEMKIQLTWRVVRVSSKDAGVIVQMMRVFAFPPKEF